MIFRKSGTGSVGTTLRVYFEKYDSENVKENAQVALKDIIEFGLSISKIQ